MICPSCDNDFNPVRWLPWRVAGYCKPKCHPLDGEGEVPGVLPFSVTHAYGKADLPAQAVLF